MFKEIKEGTKDNRKRPGKSKKEAIRNEKNTVKVKNSNGWTKRQTTIWEKTCTRL